MVSLYRVNCQTPIFHREQLLINFESSWGVDRRLSGSRKVPLSIEQIIREYIPYRHAKTVEEQDRSKTQRFAAEELFYWEEAVYFKDYLQKNGHREIEISKVSLPLPSDAEPLYKKWHTPLDGGWCIYRIEEGFTVEGYPHTSPPISITQEMESFALKKYAEEGAYCLANMEYLHTALNEYSVASLVPDSTYPDATAYADRIANLFMAWYENLEEEKGWVIQRDGRQDWIEYLVEALRLGYKPGLPFEQVLDIGCQLYKNGFSVQGNQRWFPK